MVFNVFVGELQNHIASVVRLDSGIHVLKKVREGLVVEPLVVLLEFVVVLSLRFANLFNAFQHVDVLLDSETSSSNLDQSEGQGSFDSQEIGIVFVFLIQVFLRSHQLQVGILPSEDVNLTVVGASNGATVLVRCFLEVDPFEQEAILRVDIKLVFTDVHPQQQSLRLDLLQHP